MQEGGWWMVFTAVCLVSLVGLLEYKGEINLIDDDSESPAPPNNTSDDMHPLGESCLTTHDVAMHFHPYLTILIDGEEYLIPSETGMLCCDPKTAAKMRKGLLTAPAPLPKRYHTLGFVRFLYVHL